MIKKKSHLSTVKTFIILFVAVVVAPIIFLSLTTIFLLNNSLDSLLENNFGLRYKVEGRKYGQIIGFDTGASWWVTLDNDSIGKIVQKVDSYHVEWEDELDIEKKFVQGNFSYQHSLDNYELYEVELGLGRFSICSNDKYPCNISLLIKDGEANMFVSIHKI